jgi:hypothetical protein
MSESEVEEVGKITDKDIEAAVNSSDHDLKELLTAKSARG